ncbi:hypothetical protein V6N12_014119 [Hibiscus sabdariffa]|uniref:Glutathione peroxidase n=1 Tax=Hibiscus sabdariffa TaxID=183260 RepID=A0ABR2DJ71_9ROSI
MGASESVPQKSIHEFTVKDYRNQDVDQFSLWLMLPLNGLEILAFPCNQFLNQEPGSSEEAQEFACTRYKAEYPIFQKVHVNGPKTQPVYNFLKSNTSGFLGSRIKWNFTKFLVDKDGSVLARCGPSTAPLAFEADIKKALGVDMSNL